MSMHVEQDPYRYINWAVFALAAAINSIPTQAFSGVSPIISEVYEITEFEANIPGFIFPLSYLFMLIPSNYILDKKGLKPGTLFCQTCMILGLLIRLLINVHIYLFFVGTFVCSLGFCFMLSGANKFANLWFPHNQIFMVSSICVFALFTSDALGVIFSSLFIRKQSTKQQIFDFFLWQSAIMIAIHIVMAVFFRGKPKHIQNFASTVHRNPFKEDLKALVFNKNYRILFLCTTFVFGAVSIIYVFLPWISKAYQYESVVNGYVIISANIAGCLGCVIVSTFGKDLAYKTKTLILAAGEIVAIGILWLSFEVGSYVFSCLAGAAFGLMCYPLLTTLTDFATQTTFPVGQATSSGILLFGGQFSGVFLSVIFSFIFDGQSLNLTRLLNGLLVFLLIMALITGTFTKEILRRDDYQDEQAKKSLLQDGSVSQKQSQ